METDMYVTKAVLEDIHSAADSLRTMIDSTTYKISNMNMASSLTGVLIHWGWLCLILIALYQFSVRIAGIAATGTAVVILFKISLYPWLLSIMRTDTILIHYASGLRIRLTTVILIAAVCSMLGLTTLFYRFYSRRTHLCNRFSDLIPELSVAKKVHDHRFKNQLYDIEHRTRSIYDEGYRT